MHHDHRSSTGSAVRDPSVRDTATNLRVAIGSFRRRAQETSDAQGLTGPQLVALSRLERHGPSTTADLARWAQITPQAMGATIAGLEQSGLVVRSADANDGRRAILTITEPGRDAVYAKRSALVDRIERALTESFTPEEIAALDAALPVITRLTDLI